MRKLLFTLLAVLSFTTLFSQIVKPVKWSSKVEKVSANEFNLIFDAVIEPEWHVYSQHTPENGPLPLTLDWVRGGYELVGKTLETPYKKQFNDIFEVDEYYFEKNFRLTQKVRILSPSVTSIKVTVDYQVCKEACINGSQDFTFAIPKIEIPAEPVKATPMVIDTVQEASPATIDSAMTQVETDTVATISSPKKKTSQTGLWGIFFLSFIGGFAALMTPCVFPMIPMTVSYFTKQSKTRAAGVRNAFIYGLSIILIYVALGSVITAIFGAEALNELSTNVWFNLIFFLLLVIFAMSFLGAFEIMLPNSWANKVDRQADRGGIVGILFMALALAIVSFSCTGIIVGDLLVIAASKGGMAPVIGMLGFSLALALPFMLFAMFPGWLNTLPKSGGWLNTVKVSLGFLELALAFKFLSNADLVMQAHLLERETFLAIWIAVFGVWGLYLLGKITLPHDSPLPFISVGRLMLALLVLSFTVYMIPGLFGAPLKLISAFPPPQTYSESPSGWGSGTVDRTEQLPDGAKFGEHGIVTFTDYEKGLAYAKSVGKPVLIDFTGFACVNCRKMEINVWSDEQVLKVLQNEVVLISLYVDDKRPLPESEQFVSPTTGKKVKTIGNKWTDFMISRYETNTQPFYVLMGHDEKNLVDPVGYTPDIKEYLAWLKSGVSRFK
jgi:thiol:disulfide interchange protein